jgi:SWI/SNF-related matrix-associated actin-dependent regulator of chromatin subfamily A protein 2/4
MMFRPVVAEGYESTEWQDVDYSADWSEMGCYKTTSGIWLAERRIEAFGKTSFTPRLLIITSRNGKGTYYDAIPKTLELKGWRFFDVNVGGVTERVGDIVINKWEISEFVDFVQKIEEKCVILAHYHCFTNKSPVRQWLHRLTYSYIIVDEAHKIKNKDGQWTRHMKKLSAVAGRHVMTGTGFVNSPDEIWSLLNFLDPQRWSTYGGFRRYFCDEVDMGDYKEIIGVDREHRDEFRALVRSLGPRREMREVHKDIQEPIVSAREVDLNPIQRAMYDQIRLELYTLDQKGEPISSPNVLSLLNRLRQICVATPDKVDDYYDALKDRRVQVIRLIEPSSKLDEFMDLLNELRWDNEKKHKVVVFSQFKDPLELLEARLAAKNVPYIHMLAKHNDEQRYKLWHDEWPKPNHQVFMSTLDLGGESINLTPGQYCVFLDRSWSPRANNQAIGRVYRPGQSEAAELIYINARRTTDQRMIATNERKTGWFKEIFGDEPED